MQYTRKSGRASLHCVENKMQFAVGIKFL